MQAEKSAAAESPSGPPVGGLGDDPNLYESRQISTSPTQMTPQNQYGQPNYGYANAQQDSYPMYDSVGYDGPAGDGQHGAYDVEMSQRRRV
jgi:hypothetical protein